MKLIFKISKNEIRKAKKCCEYIEEIEEYRPDCKNCPLGSLDECDLKEYLCVKVDELDEKRDHAIALVFKRKGTQIISTEVIEIEGEENEKNSL